MLPCLIKACRWEVSEPQEKFPWPLSQRIICSSWLSGHRSPWSFQNSLQLSVSKKSVTEIEIFFFFSAAGYFAFSQGETQPVFSGFEKENTSKVRRGENPATKGKPASFSSAGKRLSKPDSKTERISLIVRAIEHLFISLLVAGMNSWERCIFRSSTHFLIGWFLWF